MAIHNGLLVIFSSGLHFGLRGEQRFGSGSPGGRYAKRGREFTRNSDLATPDGRRGVACVSVARRFSRLWGALCESVSQGNEKGRQR